MKQHHLVIVTLVCLLALAAPPAFAASPLPTFDEEAVRTYPPYMRTGKSDIEIEQKEVKTHEDYREGNTGTEEDPAFFIKSVKLTGYEVLDDKGAADDGIAPWAEPSDKTTAAVADFFVWLTGSKRKPAKDDDKLFAKFLYAVMDGAKVKLCDRLESFEPVELIEMAVDGRMTVSGGGMK